MPIDLMNSVRRAFLEGRCFETVRQVTVRTWFQRLTRRRCQGTVSAIPPEQRDPRLSDSTREAILTAATVPATAEAPNGSPDAAPTADRLAAVTAILAISRSSEAR